MAFLLIVLLCGLAAVAGARGALLVPIFLWPIDRLPWPAALLVAAVGLLAWRSFANRALVRTVAARPAPRTIVIDGATVRTLRREGIAR
jgi:hypothetical protein